MKDLITIEELGKLSGLFRGKCGRAFARFAMHLTGIDKCNAASRAVNTTGPDAAKDLLEYAGIKYQTQFPGGELNLPEGAFITISNHVYGAMDGVSLLDIIGHKRPSYKLLANRVLSRIHQMEDSFISVDPKGNEAKAATSASISGIRTAMKHLSSGEPLGFFPAGAVSDLSVKEGFKIRDREWQDSVIRLIMKAKVPVIPVHFIDRNTNSYFALGLLGWKIRLLRLPREQFNKKGKPFRLVFGDPIPPEKIAEFSDDVPALKSFLRNSVYSLRWN